ncbi:flavin monoamine oxidase family protein [Methylocystis sp. S23]
MLDVAIVGGGICGLALARSLARGASIALFEARGRLGGRVLSVENRTAGLRLDLGPTWFWPRTQPAICTLIEELGLEAFDQHDPGSALYLADAKAPPVIRAAPGLHDGARRLEGGMASLVEALAGRLPPGAIRLGHVLRAARDMTDHVELRFDVGGRQVGVAARRVALAVPPRLLAERVDFAPVLPADLLAAMRDAPTWMAAQAKAVMGFADSPIWRAFGQSGAAFVTHDLAILGEVFDACDASGKRAALGGFFALSPELREKFGDSLPMLAAHQFSALFGKPLEGGEVQVHDWAAEAFTCTNADRVPPGAHPDYGAPLLSEPLWSGRLHFGASETAREGGGYVEGALNAAARIEKRIAARQEAAVMTMSDTPVESGVNQISLERFRQWVASQREPVFADYRKRLHHALSHGARDQLTQRAMLGAMEDVFAHALAVIDELPFDPACVAIERGRSDLMPRVQAAFDGFIQGFLDAVIDFNRTSCALSNFPQEHRLSKDYVSATLRDVAAAWREFSLAANSRLLARRADA